MAVYKTIEKYLERRTYIQGEFNGKFIGYFDARKSDVTHENFYDLEVISGEISTTKNEFNLRHWQSGEPEEFQGVEKFLTGIPDNLPLVISDEDGVLKTYIVNLNDKKLSDYTLSNQVYDGVKVFGDITGKISGYLKHYDVVHEDILIEDIALEKSSLSSDTSIFKTNKPTGNTERSGGYKRWEYYYSDGTTYWGAWIKQPTKDNSNFSFWEILGITLQIFIAAVIIIPFLIYGWKVILFISVLFGILYLFTSFENVFFSIFKWSIRLAGISFLLLMFFGIVSSVLDSLKYPEIKKTSVIDDVKEVTIIEPNTVLGDSIISHHRIWQDYTNTTYEADLQIRISDFKNAARFRKNLSIPLNSTSQYDRIVSKIYDFNVNKLDLVYTSLDSLQIEKNLNKLEFAEVIVSLIQDIPYTLILDNACNAQIYNDNFIEQYLDDNGECEGYIKYGLLSPVEFISTLKGDCDTRTLLLFTIFNHYNYDVAILSSELYKHSIIGINLPYTGISKSINGKNYVVWETTDQGIPPGIISREISDMRFWNISLISNKKQSI